MIKRFAFLAISVILAGLWNTAMAGIQVSTTLPTAGTPEHIYTMVNGNGVYANGNTGTTQTADNYGKFAFYDSGLGDGSFRIYSVTAKKWLSYSRSSSYSAKTNFVTLATNKPTYGYFSVNEYSSGLYQIQPYTSSSAVASIYLNWYQGIGSNPLDDSSVRLGLWTQNGATDAGSRFTIEEVIVIDPVTPVTPCLPENLSEIRAKYGTGTYSLAEVYPTQQTSVGEAKVAQENNDTVFTLYNDVLAATFVKDRGHLFFGGSDAMNLEAGTEPFTISVGSGTTIPASCISLKSLNVENLVGDNDSIGGAQHFNGKALVAEYEYAYGSSTLGIIWRAVLRDGSHYLRTEMELKGNGDVKMFNVIPLIYNVNTTNAGSTPAVIGNTRGAVVMSDKIFAGLENPVGYNTVGDAEGEDDKYDLSNTITQSLTSSSWTQMASADVPARVTEVTGYGYPNIYQYNKTGVALKANQKVSVTIAYKSGNNRLNFGGVDLLDATGGVAANDYHSGYSGSAASKNTFSFIAPNDGTYTIRAIVENGTESITASSTMTINIYTPKEGVIITGDIVPIQGRWSRNTTLQDGETWKISAVVGLVAQDKNSGVANYNINQKRRSFLAYSERERAVPWRCNPSYISWYELNINRNNAAPGSEATNMQADEVIDVENHWYNGLWKPYGIGPANFVIDDGWDNYGTWTFHTAFPNEMRDISALAAKMNAGTGAWLGPVGGYGQSGTYRRKYWTDKGESMVLSNPNYYKVFKDAATNLVNNQGSKADGHKSFEFFKFDGISAQLSAVGPDDGDTGNENAEGIIRLERFVREELERDIFFNTTVGTWASPFWYHYTDATWRQENDYGTIGDNAIDREKWITYRDRLVYQNYVKNSPICPINTLMTHGFILSKYGSVSTNMDYDACLRELRCAFACGSGMVELYNDYSLMNSINSGHLWCDLANLIQWQKKNADVLPDAHWVGGNPWDGSNENIYGWGAWNRNKAVLTLRNGDDGSATKSITLTLREALNIPAEITGTVNLKKSWDDQAVLAGWPSEEDIDIDKSLTLTLPKNTVYMFSTDTVKVAYVEPQAQGITDLSQLSNDKVYNLRCARGYALYSDAVPTQICGSNGKSVTAPGMSSTDATQQFKIIKNGSNYYLYSVKAQKYVGSDGTYVDGQTAVFKMEKSGNSEYPWKLYIGSNCMNLQESNQTDAGLVVNSWTTTDAGNIYYIQEAIPESYKYAVHVKGIETTDDILTFGDKNYADGDTIDAEGEILSSKIKAIARSGYYSVATIINKNIIVSYIPTTTKFYTIYNGKSSGYVSMNSDYLSSGNCTVSNSNAPRDTKGLWMFQKQTDGTYLIYNYSTGLAKVLGITGTEASARATMYPADSTTTASTIFTGTFNLGSTSNPSYIKINGGNHWWNNRNNMLALWEYSSVTGDEGSKWYTTAVDPTEYPETFYQEYNTVEAGTRPTDVSMHTLWYDTPANKTGVSDTWMEYALPIGDGQIGATFRGGVKIDELQLNEKTLWTGSPTHYGYNNHGYYQNLGSLFVEDQSGDFSSEDSSVPVKNYKRWLDIENGVGGVSFDGESTSYERTYVASLPDNCIAANYKATGDKKLNLWFYFVPDTKIGAGSVSYSNAEGEYSGKPETVSFATRFHVVSDGTVTTDTKGVHVSGDATYATVYIAAGTNFDPDKSTRLNGTVTTVKNTVKSRITAVAEKEFETVRSAAVEAFEKLMGETKLSLATTPSEKTTEELIKYYNTSTANKNSADGLYLEQLYWQYGRYLEVAANANTSMKAPSNLQGIWNDRSNSNFWHCDIHADVNVQMNYWPAEPGNLSDMHLPFLNWIIAQAQPGGNFYSVADQIAGKDVRGWTTTTETDMLGGLSSWEGARLKTLGAWYITHLWQHYKYTLDKDFLRTAFPVMLTGCQFMIDIASEATDGTMEIPNEYSPEHGSTENGTAFAQQLAREACDETIKAYEALDDATLATDAEMTELRTFYGKLDTGLKTETFTYNSQELTLLREWKYTAQNTVSDWNSHRHLSHLMCLYPLTLVNAYATDANDKALYDATVMSLKWRGDAATGWSMGWKTNLWARALDGEHARSILNNALRHSTSYTINMGGNGGCYYNLFDAHSPFQIDGNYGVCAGINEMLLQSYNGITILPALPSAWTTGSVKDLKAEGNFTVSIDWKDGAPTQATIISNKGAELKVRTGCGSKEIGDVKVTVDGAEVAPAVQEDGSYIIPAAEGQTVVIDYTSQPTGINAVGSSNVNNSKTTEAPMYDMSGRKITEPRGVYVQNGKKMVK